ncbi:MAG: MoaD/ThiS family protein [Chloroflexi bacterium]|nr:MoaD/ThiS family protein [Chloroflexota bacterium]
MPATLRLGASLKQLLGGRDEFSVEVGRSVRDTALSLGINPDLVAMVSANGEMQTKDYIIKEGDAIRLLAVVGGG